MAGGRMPRRALWKPLAAGVASFSLLLPAVASAGEKPRGYELAGLDAPVRVTVDTWGVPHITARSTGDLFRAQGFVAARDRLFQLDTWRRKGLGELSAVLGPEYLRHDRAARLFRYRGDMAREWASYGPGAREAATEFAAGVNAYIDWLAEHPGSLPEEFTRLGYAPARWAPEDVVRIRTHALVSNLSTELARARAVCAGGPAAAAVVATLEPPRVPRVPAGLDPCDIPADVSEVYDLATGVFLFQPGTPGGPRTVPAPPAPGGSNAWALSPGRTATGRPILANDPHRLNALLPTSRYLVHLTAPGIDVIGAGEPWAPGVSMGHNGEIAFGLTNLPADQADLYVYETDPDDPGRYRYGDGWEKFRTVTERVPVAGGPPVPVELAFTRHGPVIRTDPAKNRAYAVRTVWTEPGTAPYLGSLAYLRAGDFTEFRHALRRWRTPGSNLAYADTGGRVGLVAAGTVPRRTGEGYDGLLPVPGDGRYEWDGFHGTEDLPYRLDPPAGYVATANEFNFPADHPVMPGYEWAMPFRKDRIDAVLSARRDGTVQDQVNLQNDTVSAFATALVPHLRGLTSDDPRVTKALELLRGYDGGSGAGSAVTPLFETWTTRFLHPRWLAEVHPRGARDPAFFTDPQFTVVLESFAEPEKWFGPDGAAVRDRLLLATLKEAYAAVAAELGPDPAAWRWGDLHTHTFFDPVFGTALGPIPRGGTHHTPKISLYFPGGFAEAGGATFSMVLDVGSWDASRALNAPGQSGDRRSPHHADLHRRWAAGDPFPLLYGRSAVEAAAADRFLLRPRRG
ncbi:penicillin acylase family protein [Streptomyces sp. NPDC020875]|uniref:penicillin acylase family protein n=1 Tax=Streptomyces sp. NPDC020875 TaxID=3154898 RepID=UPI0033C22E55